MGTFRNSGSFITTGWYLHDEKKEKKKESALQAFSPWRIVSTLLAAGESFANHTVREVVANVAQKTQVETDWFTWERYRHVAESKMIQASVVKVALTTAMRVTLRHLVGKKNNRIWPVCMMCYVCVMQKPEEKKKRVCFCWPNRFGRGCDSAPCSSLESMEVWEAHSKIFSLHSSSWCQLSLLTPLLPFSPSLRDAQRHHLHLII